MLPLGFLFLSHDSILSRGRLAPYTVGSDGHREEGRADLFSSFQKRVGPVPRVDERGGSLIFFVCLKAVPHFCNSLARAPLVACNLRVPLHVGVSANGCCSQLSLGRHHNRVRALPNGLVAKLLAQMWTKRLHEIFPFKVTGE